jgi:hypothetical protein
MTKQKWVIAIACGVAVGTLSFAWNMWQSSNNRAAPESLPEFPAVTQSPQPELLPSPTPSPTISDPTPAQTPESRSPKDNTHSVNVLLGAFQHSGDIPDQQRGWFSDGVDDMWSPYTVRDFTESQYLILEFNREPNGEIEFAWIGDSNDWEWTSTSFTPNGNILIIDLARIDGYNQYRQASLLKIFICCYDDSWESLKLADAYFADTR